MFIIITIAVWLIIGGLWVLWDIGQDVVDQPQYIRDPNWLILLLSVVFWPLRLLMRIIF